MPRGAAAVKENCIFIIYFTTPIYVLALLSTATGKPVTFWLAVDDWLIESSFNPLNFSIRAYLPSMYSTGLVAYIWKWSVVITAQWYIGRSQTSFPLLTFSLLLLLALCLCFLFLFFLFFFLYSVRLFLRSGLYKASAIKNLRSSTPELLKRKEHDFKSVSLRRYFSFLYFVCMCASVCACVKNFRLNWIFQYLSIRLSNSRAIDWKVDMFSSANVSTAILRPFKRA